MLRNELKSDTVEDSDFIQEVSSLHRKVQGILESENEGHQSRKWHPLFDPDNQTVLNIMKKRELLRTDKMEARQWIQHVNAVRRNKI